MYTGGSCSCSAKIWLGALELGAAGLDGPLERGTQGVQGHPGLAVADAAQGLGELALPAEVADARLLELVGARRARDRALRLGFQGLRVHRATVPSALVDSYRAFAAIYDDWASHMTEDVPFSVELARGGEGPCG